MTNYVNLPKPQGFLVWRGKQPAFISAKQLDEDKCLIVTDDEAFGYAKLEKPIQVSSKVILKPEYQEILCPKPDHENDAR